MNAHLVFMLILVLRFSRLQTLLSVVEAEMQTSDARTHMENCLSPRALSAAAAPDPHGWRLCEATVYISLSRSLTSTHFSCAIAPTRLQRDGDGDLLVYIQSLDPLF